MRILFFVLALAVFAGGQTLPKGFIVDYDKFKDQTTVMFSEDTPVTPKLEMVFMHDGERLAVDQELFAFIISDKCRSLCFDGETGFIIIVDGGKPVKIAQRDVHSNSVSFSVYRDKLTLMANAKESIEFQVGSREGVWLKRDIDNFQTMLKLGTATTKPIVLDIK